MCERCNLHTYDYGFAEKSENLSTNVTVVKRILVFYVKRIVFF